MRLPRIISALWCVAAFSMVLSAPLPAVAVTPEEMLADPALEERARTLSKQLRCLVCQNQSIDDSDADLALDLRVEVRRQLSTGSSDAEILANLRDTYGDYVLLNPPVSPGTYVLWGSPVFILLAGAAIIMAGRRRREDAGGTVTEGPVAPPAMPLPPGTRRTAIALGSLVMAVSLGLYLMLGRADLPGQPLAGRGAELAAAADASNAQTAERQADLDEARSAAAASPEDVGAWLRLAMAAAAAGETNTELAALEQAEQLTKGDPAIRAMRAEAMSRAADGQVTIPARELIADILTEDPSEPRALFLSGLAAYQDENFGAAVEIWLRLQSLSAPDAP
ncbi:MAG: cytochrome c-type biogenesis protein CcmH, partial [Pseudomonadota bacterium]|nr:cytochrome c-type biogenesis protein CcmH [Pseudomonadota bacterium]